jgi:galactonate dehydratase
VCVKITGVATYLVPPRWLFAEVMTDEGLSGWGEPVVEGRARTVAAAVEEAAEYLVGRDPLHIEDHWQALTRGTFYRGGPVLSSAVAGLDQALWDIAGKFYGAPVHALLGGPVRQRARLYSWIGGDRPERVAEQAAAQAAEGLTAVKMNATAELEHIDRPRRVDAIVARVAAVREALGDDLDVAVDFHGRASLPMARRLLPMLEPYRPLFVEEALRPEHSERFEELAATSGVPLATGERLYSRWDFKRVLPGGISVVQPDVSHAGGISEVMRIASLAETYDAALAPHCPLGPVSLAASLQVAFAAPNFLIQEQSLGIHYNVEAELLDYLVDASVFDTKEGYVDRLTGPGLGIEVDKQAVVKAAEVGHDWHSPVWRHRDGSYAEW